MVCTLSPSYKKRPGPLGFDSASSNHELICLVDREAFGRYVCGGGDGMKPRIVFSSRETQRDPMLECVPGSSITSTLNANMARLGYPLGPSLHLT